MGTILLTYPILFIASQTSSYLSVSGQQFAGEFDIKHMKTYEKELIKCER